MQLITIFALLATIVGLSDAARQKVQLLAFPNPRCSGHVTFVTVFDDTCANWIPGTSGYIIQKVSANTKVQLLWYADGDGCVGKSTYNQGGLIGGVNEPGGKYGDNTCHDIPSSGSVRVYGV
jgi:hypothetical protein